MNIGKAELDDLPRILAIQKEAYRSEAEIYNDYSLPPLQQTLDGMMNEFRHKLFLKAVVDGPIVGSVRVQLNVATCSIEKLIVDPRFQGQGIGSALLALAEDAYTRATRFELFTGAKSEANIRLYERHGYTRFREEVISPNLTLVFMEKFKTQEAHKR